MRWSHDVLCTWNQQVSKIIGTIGTESFLSALIEAVETVVPDIVSVLFVNHENDPPRAFFDNFPEDSHTINVDEYLAGAYLMDPYYKKLSDNSSVGLLHVAYEDFIKSEY